MSIRIGGVFLADEDFLKKDIIEAKDIFMLYAISRERKDWIGSICLGYTLLEMNLIQLMKLSDEKRSRISNSKINKCRYLIELAQLALDENIIDKSIFDIINNFNDIRNSTIHKLAKGKTTKSELEKAAKSVTDCLSKLQPLYGIIIKFGPEEHNPHL